MKNYYEILGVSVTATLAEIKQAYRKLALQYHPDKNDAPEAEIRFKEINEVYRVLSHTERRSAYDARRNAAQPQPQFYPTTPRQTTRPLVPPSALHKAYEQEKKLRLFVIANEPIMAQISILAFAFSVLIWIDFALPTKEEIQSIADWVVRENVATVKFADGTNAIRSGGKIITLAEDSLIRLHYTRLFHVCRTLQYGANEMVTFRPTIYGNFIFFPVLLSLSALSSFLWPRQIEFRFNAGIVNAILASLNALIICFFG